MSAHPIEALLRPPVELWSALVALAAAAIAWLVAGGLCYTGGIWFYRHKEMPYSHLVWHLFVIAGTVCHVVAIMGYGY